MPSDREDVVTPHEAAQQARIHFQLDAMAEPLPGEHDLNFRLRTCEGKQYVLKIFHRSRALDWVDLQNCVLRHIETAAPQLPVPRTLSGAAARGVPVWQRAGQPDRGLQCISFLHGEPMRGTAATPARRRSLGAFQARVGLALRGFSHPAEPYDLVWDTKRAHERVAWIEAIRDPAIRSMARDALHEFRDEVAPLLPQLRSQAIHNDFNPDNILIAGDEVGGLIDFGDLVRSPLVQDLATSCAYQAIRAHDPLTAVLDVAAGYDRLCPLHVRELDVLLAYVAARLALIITVGARNAHADPANAPYLLRNQDIAARCLQRLRARASDLPERWLASQLRAQPEKISIA